MLRLLSCSCARIRLALRSLMRWRRVALLRINRRQVLLHGHRLRCVPRLWPRVWPAVP